RFLGEPLRRRGIGELPLSHDGDTGDRILPVEPWTDLFRGDPQRADRHHEAGCAADCTGSRQGKQGHRRAAGFRAGASSRAADRDRIETERYTEVTKADVVELVDTLS